MPKNHGPTVKNDRQYEAMRDRGMSKEKAARVANANAGSSGNQASKRGGRASKYEEQTKDQLLKRARQVGIEGRSKMDKGELISALRNH
jgi:hypothetical protein